MIFFDQRFYFDLSLCFLFVFKLILILIVSRRYHRHRVPNSKRSCWILFENIPRDEHFRLTVATIYPCVRIMYIPIGNFLCCPMKSGHWPNHLAFSRLSSTFFPRHFLLSRRIPRFSTEHYGRSRALPSCTIPSISSTSADPPLIRSK